MSYNISIDELYACMYQNHDISVLKIAYCGNLLKPPLGKLLRFDFIKSYLILCDSIAKSNSDQIFIILNL